MKRDPRSVPCTFIQKASQLDLLAKALKGAERVAIDTETPIDGPHARQLRVMSIATRRAAAGSADDGVPRGDGDSPAEEAFVIDARDVPPPLLAPLLTGVTASAWNANFDARVIDAAVWETTDTTPHLTWWDAQLADALIFQGRSGVTWYHGLAWATEHYLNIRAEGKGTTQLSYTAFDDLTEDQIAYAAADAVETLWVADAISSEIAAADLDTICTIEMEARPFLDRMERSGLPFDWPSWESELEVIAKESREALSRLALLTGGGQGNLFDETIEPDWNPASDRMVREVLNRHCEAEVKAWATRREGTPRTLTALDSVAASVLREIGGDICESLLDFRNRSKILTTYGDSMRDHIRDDGRLHPQYLQVVGTNTGRLASRNPNAQNFAPRMLRHIRPESAERRFVHADLSQAELRFLAQVAEDEPLRNAFARDDDVHVRTAASMFAFDADDMARTDPERLRHYRKIAKALNFGIAYGTGAAALARSLTTEGTETSADEAAALLGTYRKTYPGTASWAEDRIEEIQHVKDRTTTIDWSATMRLARGHTSVSGLRRTFRRESNRWPTVEEIAELHPHRHLHQGDGLLEEIRWLTQFSAPVALDADHTPFTFSSRTLAGRRQQFNLHLDSLFLSAAVETVRSPDPTLSSISAKFAAENGLDLVLCGNNDASGARPSESEIKKQFEERVLRRRFVEAVRAEAGREVAIQILGRAARERAGAMVNAWRNAPIQGGVADIMLVAFAGMQAALAEYPTARPVQTVHDSVVVECDAADAPAIAKLVKRELELASHRFCPDVVPRADIDIRRSLADEDTEP